ncbi:putative methyltransferase NSUN7 [Oryzias melastigma]|uniref:Putative methyltransferase NSUN7 n=1 Tax=Oryzias melastigma TaxID=30732 RepID=A0A834FFN3_ORYME|nr:putative methyltransferase NSUN7 [Oryzias melastigma]
MSAVSVKRALNDNASSSEDVNMNPETELAVPSDQNHTNNLPTLPRLDLHSNPDSPPSDQVYLQAAAIFQWLHAEKPAPHHLMQHKEKTDTPLSGSGDKNTQKQAFQLAFSTLKYQELLLDVISNSRLQKCPHMVDGDLLPLAMVMLFDLQENKFALQELSPKEGQDVFQEVRDLQRSLQKCKTKLAANLARFRVKHRLRSVSRFLPDSVRTKQTRAKTLPLYAWINTCRISLADMCEALQSAGLIEAQNITDLTEFAFCKDPLCPDTLVFHQSLQARLMHSSLAATRLLNLQDRSVCLAVRVLQPLLYEKADVLVVGSFSALTVAHIATVAASRVGRVLVCGTDHTASQVKEMQELLTQMDIQNVQILSESFSNLSEWDASAQMIRVIAVLPQCSSSALNDPVPTMYSEHGDWTLLPGLSQGSVSSSKMLSLTAKQSWLLGHALTFPKVQTVLYCTRSVYPEENEDLVRKVLEKTRTPPKLLPFRVSGPIFPDDSPPGAAADPRFFRLAPSHLTNGCFIARISRQADPTKVETVQDVLARAAAKGLLGGIIPEPPRGRKKGKSKKTQAASSTSKPSSPSEQEKREGEDYENPTSEQGEEIQQEDLRDDGEKGKGEKKKKRKRAGKKQTRKADSVQKKSTKKKGNQSHDKKPKQIPRLTLASISSDKPSSSLTLITALAHKISGNPAGQTEPGSAASITSALRRPNVQQAGAETLKDSTKPSRQEKAAATQGAVRPKDHALPPISCLTSSSQCNRSRSSVSPQPASTSASVSSISLPDI